MDWKYIYEITKDLATFDVINISIFRKDLDYSSCIK